MIQHIQKKKKKDNKIFRLKCAEYFVPSICWKLTLKFRWSKFLCIRGVLTGQTYWNLVEIHRYSRTWHYYFTSLNHERRYLWKKQPTCLWSTIALCWFEDQQDLRNRSQEILICNVPKHITCHWFLKRWHWYYWKAKLLLSSSIRSIQFILFSTN